MGDIDYAILGAGNGGLSYAGDMILRGIESITLYDRYEGSLAPLRARGGIEMIGDYCAGFAPLQNITTDMEKALCDADVIFVVVPSIAHEWIAREMAPHVSNGQTIVIMPGFIGGALIFERIFDEKNVEANVTIAETDSILYATRLVGPAQVGIQAIKRTFKIASKPSNRTEYVLEMLNEALPQLVAARNVLETGFNNLNPMTHVVMTILNWARIELGDSDKGRLDLTHNAWQSQTVQRLNEKLDAERVKVGRALGLKMANFNEIFSTYYEGEDHQIVNQKGPVPESSSSIPPRYIDEDVPMGLVPLVSFADVLDVDVPVARTLVNMACLIRDRDFWSEGRDLASMNLDNISVDRIIDVIEN